MQEDDIFHLSKLVLIHEKILEWGDDNLRDFLWRRTSNPYEIIIAEIMLHRTKASQVEPVYKNFIKKYSSFKEICYADEEEIIADIATLGLKWRIKSLRDMSCYLSNKYDGDVPHKKRELLELPGVGPYIASAVLCFAYDLPEPLLDTNTVRVIGRLFDLTITDSSRRSKKFENIMRNLVDLGTCKKFSLSLIDFAGAICRSIDPLCPECPINNLCSFYVGLKI